LAAYRGQLTEDGLVQAIREIYDFFYKKTRLRYTKTQLSDCWTVFADAAKEMAVLESMAVILGSDDDQGEVPGLCAGPSCETNVRQRQVLYQHDGRLVSWADQGVTLVTGSDRDRV